MQKAGIIPDIKENKPAMAYANASFLQAFTLHMEMSLTSIQKNAKSEK